MKSYKELLNEAVNNSSLRKLSDEELSAAKCCILKMYKKIAAICEQNNLTLMLGGGSVLGAVRHKGFIPWDDDMDLSMPRADYNKLLSLCEDGVLGDEYDYTFPRKNQDAPCAFLKIYSRDTKVVGLGGEDYTFPCGLDIDVFPIEGAPSNKLYRKCMGLIANMLRLIMNIVGEAKTWPKSLREFYGQDKRFYFFMKCRQLLGKCFSIISHKRWVYWFDTFVKNEKITDVVVIPTGRKLYNGETYASSVFFPVSKGTFEGLEVNLPANPDEYLSILYGDYMKIPPIEKRESHMIIDLYIPQDYYDKK